MFVTKTDSKPEEIVNGLTETQLTFYRTSTPRNNSEQSKEIFIMNYGININKA